MKIIALLVTYNRKDLLIESIDAILNQKYEIDSLVVIDNNSSDGTNLLFEDNFFNNSKIKYIRLNKNIGGAGGFHHGMKYINENLNYDFIWLMDDDAIANSTTLKCLVDDFVYLNKESEEKISFIASSVFGPENEPMNVPIISEHKNENGYFDWYYFLGQGLVKLTSATFVSLLIKKEAVQCCGYPLEEYFIWGDDTEYTMRLIKYYGNAYFSGRSSIVHKRFNARSLSIYKEDNVNRISMYKYYYKNTLTNKYFYGTKKEFLTQITKMFLGSFKVFFLKKIKFRVKKFIVMQSGIFSFIFKLNKKNIKNTICNEKNIKHGIK